MTRVLRSLYLGWLAVGRVLGAIQTKLLLCVIFWIVITPLGLVRRLLLGSALTPGPRLSPEGRKTYWLPPSSSESGSQHMDHMY